MFPLSVSRSRVSACSDASQFLGRSWRLPCVAPSTRDFHLFEDGKEQTIESANPTRNHSRFPVDSLGPSVEKISLLRGESGQFSTHPLGIFSLSPPFYEMAYRPALSPEGSCHKIKIEVDSKDESGHRMTVTEAGPIQAGGIVYTLKSEADRVIWFSTTVRNTQGDSFRNRPSVRNSCQ